MARLPVWVAAVWWCSLGVVGFFVVPLLFSHLPTPAMAGAVAAKLFTAQTWLSSLCALMLLMFFRSNWSAAHVSIAQTAIVFIVGGMLLALLSEFAVTPRILMRENMRLWHGVGVAMYVLQWLCAGVTFWKLTPSRQ
jgi:predicted cobalt transporter CbtA